MPAHIPWHNHTNRVKRAYYLRIRAKMALIHMEEEENRSMPSYLHQVVAIEKDHKDKASQELTRVTGLLNNSGKLTGIARSYTPRDEGGSVLPPESTRVQVKAGQSVKSMQAHLASLFDVVATKDWANCIAKSDVVVDGKVIIANAPATYILFLEKQLAELLAFAKKLPALDPSFSWEHDASQDCWVTPPVETVRTKKTKKSTTVFEGTQHHPPQFLVWDEDIPEGTWSTLHYSGAMQQEEINAIIERIEKLQKSVKFAREQANRQEVTQQHVGEAVLQYVFG
jgi:hypothetical protein